MGREKSLALHIGRSLWLVKIVGFVGLITLAARASSEDAYGEPTYGILCISECPTCPEICSPPPPPLPSPSSKPFPPPPTPRPPVSQSPPGYYYTNPPSPPRHSSPTPPNIYPIWGAPPPLPPPPPPSPPPPSPPPPPPYKYNKPPPPWMPNSPIVVSPINSSSPFYYLYASNAVSKSSLPAYLCTLLLLPVLSFRFF